MKKILNVQNKRVSCFINNIKVFLFILFLIININETHIYGKTKYKMNNNELIFKNASFSFHKKKIRTKISIFIPIYNKENFIYKCIKSIQSQTLKDIEIIAVNDHSTDNSLKILINLAKIDNRIKIINNEQNHGLLYCRALGIMSSTGEYLMNIDSDDNLKGYNSLKNLYYKAKRYKIDIITFGFLDKKLNQNINICNHINVIQRQPELFFSIFHPNSEIKDYYIWNKLIKRETFQKSYQAFKNEINSLKWNYFEDDIWNILVNRFANSKLCINRIIYIYNYNKDSLINKKQGIIEFLNLLYRHEMYKKLFFNKENERFLIAEYLFLFKRIELQLNNLLLINDHDINHQFIKIFRNFLENYNCTDYQRKEIINLINSLS